MVFNFVARKRHRSETARVEADEPSELHCPSGHRLLGRLALPGGERGRPGVAIDERNHRREVVVRAAGQHDVLAEEQSSLPVEEERRPDAVTQILHQESEYARRERKGRR